jgi:hypothetical protein
MIRRGRWVVRNHQLSSRQYVGWRLEDDEMRLEGFQSVDFGISLQAFHFHLRRLGCLSLYESFHFEHVSTELLRDVESFCQILQSTVFPRIIAAAIWWLLTVLFFSLSNLYTILSDPLCLSFEIHQRAGVIIRGKTVGQETCENIESNQTFLNKFRSQQTFSKLHVIIIELSFIRMQFKL